MEKIEVLGGVLKRIGNFSMKTRKDRITFQKTVYFIQEFGINLGYNFHWYVYGPYSPLLAKDGFSLVDKFTKIDEVSFVDKELEIKFHDLISFLGKRKNDSVWLEALASVHFLKKISPSLSKEEIIKRVKEKQGYLNEDNVVEDAWYYLKAFNLIGN